MGEARRDALRVGFDRALKLEFHGARVSSDAGLFPYRDLDDAARLTESGAARLFDFRTGSNISHSMTALVRQSVYPPQADLAGYEDVNDADRLSVDPVMRHVVGGRAAERQAASSRQVARFETEVLTHPDNLAALMNMPGEWVDLIRQRHSLKKLILDMDSSVSETYGQQEGTAYNGHFGCECYHPLFLFNQDGDVELALLRNGNVASANDWRTVLEPVIARYRNPDLPRFFRADAAFAIPELYELLEAEGYRYAIRLKANPILQEHITHLLTRPVGRPPKGVQRFYHSFDYQAQSWDVCWPWGLKASTTVALHHEQPIHESSEGVLSWFFARQRAFLNRRIIKRNCSTRALLVHLYRIPAVPITVGGVGWRHLIEYRLHGFPQRLACSTS